MDPTLATAIASVANKTIATALKYDPGTQMALQSLRGKVFAIHCTGPALSLYVFIDDGQVRVSAYCEEPVHCTLSGSAGALVALLWHDNHSLADSGVTVSGEPGLLGSIQQLIKQLDIDWQQALSDALGETAAAPLTRVLSAQGQWLRQRGERLPQWLADMLSEELQLLPSADELHVFYRDVDTVRAAGERLEARLAKLRAVRKHSTRTTDL